MKLASTLFYSLLITLSVGLQANDTLELYNKSCLFCHASGAAKAPKTHDVAAWTPRIKKGMPALLSSVKNGIGVMPPKGLCMDCTDAEFTALIELMSSAK